MKHFENIIQRNSKKITAYLEKLIQPVEKEEKEKKYLDEDWIEKICKDIHASQTMSFSLRQYMRYYALQGINYKKQFEDWYHEGKLPCKDKREGKKYFRKLRPSRRPHLPLRLQARRPRERCKKTDLPFPGRSVFCKNLFSAFFNKRWRPSAPVPGKAPQTAHKKPGLSACRWRIFQFLPWR